MKTFRKRAIAAFIPCPVDASTWAVTNCISTARGRERLWWFSIRALGDSYVSWMKVQPQIAKFTRVCSYDRAGLGYSDNSPRPRTSKVMAEELHTLLHNAGV